MPAAGAAVLKAAEPLGEAIQGPPAPQRKAPAWKGDDKTVMRGATLRFLSDSAQTGVWVPTPSMCSSAASTSLRGWRQSPVLSTKDFL